MWFTMELIKYSSRLQKLKKMKQKNVFLQERIILFMPEVFIQEKISLHCFRLLKISKKKPVLI